MLPRPKSYEKFDGRICFDCLSVAAEKEEKVFAEEYLANFLEKELFSSKASDKCLKIEIKKSPEYSNGAYKIKIEDSVLIYFGETESLRNALSTVVQLISLCGEGLYIEKGIICDYPDSRFRSVMIDLARGLPPVERLFEDIKRLALMKCNNITLHLMDSDGLCYISDVLPPEEEIRGTKLYKKEDLKNLVELCTCLGINVIPGIEIPAHADAVSRKLPELKCKTAEEKSRYWTVCAGEEKTYDFYSKLTDEICSLFPGEYIHIGGDELYFNDYPQWDMFCYWEECETCKEVMKKNNISGMRGMYYYLINRMYDIVSKRNKKMIIYNDQLDLSEDVSINKNIIVQFWRVANENRGPRKDGEINNLLKQGFKVINSAVEVCYIDLEDYANPEKISSFSYKDYQNSEYRENIIGGEACAWEYGNPSYTHYNLSFSASAALILDKLWNTGNVCYDEEYRVALTKLFLGYRVEAGYDLTSLFGSIIPPRKNDTKSYATLSNELMGKEELLRHRAALLNIDYTYSRVYKKYLLENMFTDI